MIGAGSAGCVIARRLLDAGHNATLVEAGDHDSTPEIDDVSRLGYLRGSDVDWNEKPRYSYPVTPVADVDNENPLVVQEQFGPALPLIKYTDLEEARAVALPKVTSW